MGAAFVAFRLDGTRYAVPLGMTERILPMVAVAPLPGAPDVILGVINLHGTVLPVIDVRHRFGRPRRDPGVDDRLIVATTRRRRLVLAVDEVEGVVHVDPATIFAPGVVIPGVGYLAGVAAQPDGLLLIHDLDTVLALDEESQLDGAMAGVAR